jgi:glycosyltransferase involved in cell wall biosynthesis
LAESEKLPQAFTIPRELPLTLKSVPFVTDFKYSVLIRTRNSEATVGETLQSLEQQTCTPDEVVIVDNGSSDETIARVKEASPGARIVPYPEEEPFNYSKALNLGLEKVSYSQVLILSSHVTLKERQAMERALEFLGAHEKVAAVGLGLVGKPRESKAEEVTTSGKGCSNRSQVIVREAWKKRSFAEWIPTCEDKLWYKELVGEGWKFANLSNCVDYKNPYLNPAKKCQEYYVMARYVDSRLTSVGILLVFLRIMGQKMIFGSKGSVRDFGDLFKATLAGLLGISRNLNSDSYRNDKKPVADVQTDER